MAREWVAGFLFDTDAEHVVLVRKNRPEWQAGKLNGVGGKVESGEKAGSAMRREFHEEAGAIVSDWHHFADLVWDEGTVHFYRAFWPLECLEACTAQTDEPIELHTVADLLAKQEAVVPNLMWLIPLAAYRHDSYDVIDVVETGTTLQKPGRLDVFPGEHEAPTPEKLGIEYCPASRDDMGHCDHWWECEPCCWCGDDVETTNCDCPKHNPSLYDEEGNLK